MPKPVYKSEKGRSLVGCACVYRSSGERVNLLDARFVNHVSKKVMTKEMSCPWISNREKKSAEKNYEVWPV